MTRIPLPMVPAPRPLVECTECGKCCTYVSVGINPPTSVRNATDILWYLYHENVSVYRDGDGEWSVVFETRCRNLKPDLLCAIYPERPIICREFDNTTCDVNDPEGGLSVESPEQFLEYLKARRPAVFRKVARDYLPEAIRSPRSGASAPPPAPSGGRAPSAGTRGSARRGRPR